MMPTYTLRPIERVTDFDRDGWRVLASSLEDMLEREATRRSWCFLLERDGSTIGRVGFSVDATCPPELLGRLPAREVFLFGLELPWSDDDRDEAARFLLEQARARVRHELPEAPQVVVNRERDANAEARCRALENAGALLFQEKQGFTWARAAEVPSSPPARLRFAPIRDVGEEIFRHTLMRVGANTIDRNDAWYRELAGEENWSKVFMSFFTPESDGASWLLATRQDGEPVGIVAVSAFDDDTATIVFIGVVPEHRGNGYIDDLVRAAADAARERGFATMLSDADVLNVPMTSAFVRNGHLPDVRPWHKWHYRLP